MENTIIVLLSGGWDYSLNSVLIIPLVKNNTSGFTPFFPNKYQPILHRDEGRLAPATGVAAGSGLARALHELSLLVRDPQKTGGGGFVMENPIKKG